MEDWKYNLYEEDVNRVLHTLLFEFPKVISAIEDFLAGLDGYELMTQELDETSRDLPA